MYACDKLRSETLAAPVAVHRLSGPAHTLTDVGYDDMEFSWQRSILRIVYVCEQCQHVE
jgi:hypothetical protein